jgi:hypothetical protein
MMPSQKKKQLADPQQKAVPKVTPKRSQRQKSLRLATGKE